SSGSLSTPQGVAERWRRVRSVGSRRGGGTDQSNGLMALTASPTALVPLSQAPCTSSIASSTLQSPGVIDSTIALGLTEIVPQPRTASTSANLPPALTEISSVDRV